MWCSKLVNTQSYNRSPSITWLSYIKRRLKSELPGVILGHSNFDQDISKKYRLAVLIHNNASLRENSKIPRMRKFWNLLTLPEIQNIQDTVLRRWVYHKKVTKNWIRKKAVLKNFVKSPGKYPWQSILLVKLQIYN